MKKILLSIATLVLLSTASFAQEPIEILDKPTGQIDFWDDKPDRPDMVPKYPVDIKDIPGGDKKPLEIFDKKGALVPWAGLWKVTQGPIKVKGNCGSRLGINATSSGLPSTVTIQDTFHPNQIISPNERNNMFGRWKRISSKQWRAISQPANTAIVKVNFVWKLLIISKKTMTLVLSGTIQMNVPGMGLKKCTVNRTAKLKYIMKRVTNDKNYKR